MLTRQNITIDGAQVVHSPAEAVAAAAQYDRCFVIGGDSVFRQMFPHLTRVYVTKIDAAPHSDVFFPGSGRRPRVALRVERAARQSTTAWAISSACTKKRKNKKYEKAAAFRPWKAAAFFCPHPASTVSESALMHMWKNTGGQIERVCS